EQRRSVLDQIDDAPVASLMELRGGGGGRIGRDEVPEQGGIRKLWAEDWIDGIEGSAIVAPRDARVRAIRTVRADVASRLHTIRKRVLRGISRNGIRDDLIGGRSVRLLPSTRAIAHSGELRAHGVVVKLGALSAQGDPASRVPGDLQPG